MVNVRYAMSSLKWKISIGIITVADWCDLVIHAKSVVMRQEIGYEKIQKCLIELIRNTMKRIRRRYCLITTRDEKRNDMIMYTVLLERK